MNVDQIRRLEQHQNRRWQQSTASTISTANNESRTMRSVETQTDQLDGIGGCCCGDDGASVSGMVPELGHDDEQEEGKPFVSGKGRTSESDNCSLRNGEEAFQMEVSGLVVMNGSGRTEDSMQVRCEPELKSIAAKLNTEPDEEEDEDEMEQDDEAVERSRRVRLVAANNMFNFNKLEILNERSCSASGSSEGGSQRANITVPTLLRSSSGGGTSMSDSNRNLCDNEATVAVDDAFAAAASANEQSKQREGDAKGPTQPPPSSATGMKGLGPRLDSLDAIFIQESPEVIL
uniref:Uncharacterized protein n=1 Tax=Anopheles maculatus TaxID=74869 RepID=A0A182SQB8_9DIPT